MKNLIVLFILFKCIPALSQDVQFKGIGPFVIGANLSEILEKVALTNGKVKSGLTFSDVYSFHAESKAGIMKTNYDTTSLMNAQYCYGFPGELDFTINNYEIAGIKVSKIYLIFIDSILSGFVCNVDQELKEAIMLKYGDGQLVKKLDSVACRYTSSGNIKYENTYSETASWKHDNVTVERYNSIDYDKNCKIRGYHTLTIQTKGIMLKLLKYEMDQRKIREDRRKALKKEKLKDF
ncbi:MAG: hypothetical protein IPO63_01795 [Bacteroidetes bacterium]|nr:hypothetical protein [Bacteroidota bacterium]